MSKFTFFFIFVYNIFRINRYSENDQQDMLTMRYGLCSLLKAVWWPIVVNFCVILVSCGQLTHWHSYHIFYFIWSANELTYRISSNNSLLEWLPCKDVFFLTSGVFASHPKKQYWIERNFQQQKYKNLSARQELQIRQTYRYSSQLLIKVIAF